MKKLMITAAIAFMAVASQAATVGWTNAGLNNYNGDAYKFFVIGQKGAADIATITALLDAGTDVSSYALGGGTVSGGQATVASTATGVTLGEGTYDSFLIFFDGGTPTSGTSKYAVISGQANQHKVIAATTANVTFSAGNTGALLDAATWKSYGSSSDVPEPTTGLLMLVGLAGLALRRKMA